MSANVTETSHTSALLPAADAPMVAMIERIVMDPNASVDKLERMLAMKERLDGAAARRAFDGAISSAKASIPPIIKNKTVDFTSQKGRTNYRHEDLAEIARTVDPILSANGLSYRFRSSQEGRNVTVACVMSHRDGYSEETSLSAGADESGNKNSIQAVGSTITYLQRYTLKLALGLAATTDDDGSKSAGDKISADQFVELQRLLEAAGADETQFCKFLGVELLDELSAAKHGEAVAALKRKIEKAKQNATGN